MQEKKTNVCGIISLTLGIIGIISSCTCYNLVLAVPGIILGIIGMCLPGYKKGIAIAGFITNIAAVATTAVIYIFVEAMERAMESS